MAKQKLQKFKNWVEKTIFVLLNLKIYYNKYFLNLNIDQIKGVLTMILKFMKVLKRDFQFYQKFDENLCLISNFKLQRF
jgi:hypothetical protein